MVCLVKPFSWVFVLIGMALVVSCTSEAPLEPRPQPANQRPSAPLVGIAPPVDNPVAVPATKTAPSNTATTAIAAVTHVVSATLPATPTNQPAANLVLPAFPITGIELEKINPQSLDLALQAGAYWIRRNSLRWDLVEPSEGERRWDVLAELEKEMQQVAEAGGQLILVVRGTPAWAQARPGFLCGPVKPEKLDAFARFMQDVVTRYSSSPYSVRYWEIGNEPDIDPASVSPDSLFGCLGDSQDGYFGGGEYARMLKVVYPQVKAADPGAQVLVGGLLADCDPVNSPEGKDCTASSYLEGILKAGGGDYFDGVSFHGYDYYLGPYDYANPNWNSSRDIFGPVFIPKARYLRSVLVTNQHPEKYLLNTEAGLLCGRDGSEPVCQAPEFMLTKAYYVAEMTFAALAEGLRGNVWYSLTGWRGTALIDDGQKPNLAHQAYGFAARQLSQAAFERPVNDFPGVRGYQVARPGNKLWFLLAADGQGHTLQLPFTPTAIYDVFGAPQPLSPVVALTAAPLYIEWVP